MKHPHDEVIRAYLDGKTVQMWDDTEFPPRWNDYNLSVCSWVPGFDRSEKWRIKPEAKKVKYRLYLYRGEENKFYVITAHPAAYDPAQEQRGFVKWLGPEQEYVVEEVD